MGKTPGNPPRILPPSPSLEPDIYPTSRIEDPYEFKRIPPVSTKLSFTPLSQARKREWHSEGQGTAERKAPVSCLPGSNGPGVEKVSIFRYDLTPPPHVPISHTIMVVTVDPGWPQQEKS